MEQLHILWLNIIKFKVKRKASERISKDLSWEDIKQRYNFKNKLIAKGLCQILWMDEYLTKTKSQRRRTLYDCRPTNIWALEEIIRSWIRLNNREIWSTCKWRNRRSNSWSVSDSYYYNTIAFFIVWSINSNDNLHF